MGNRFDVQENWPHCLQRYWVWSGWGADGDTEAALLPECLGAASLYSIGEIFYPRITSILALCQISNKMSPSKSPLPMAFPDLLL